MTMNARSIDEVRGRLIKKYKIGSLDSYLIKANGKYIGVLRGDLSDDGTLYWTTFEAKARSSIAPKRGIMYRRYQNTYLVNKDGTLGIKIGNAYKV